MRKCGRRVVLGSSPSFSRHRHLQLESLEDRRMLAAIDLSATNWTTEGVANVMDVDLNGDQINDAVEITLGDDSWGPGDTISVNDGGFYYFAEIRLPTDVHVMVDYERDVTTYQAAEASQFIIGTAGPDHRVDPTHILYAFGGEDPYPDTDSGRTRSYDRTSSEAYVLHVGLVAFVNEPTDLEPSFGTFTIRYIDATQSEKSHDPECGEDHTAGSLDDSFLAAQRNGEATVSTTIAKRLSMMYNSADNPHPLLQAEYIVSDASPDSIRAAVRPPAGGPPFFAPAEVHYDTSQLAPGDRITVGLQVEVPFESFFDYELEITEFTGGVPGQSEVLESRYGAQDRRFSEYGNRWFLAELDYLRPERDFVGNVTGVQLMSGESDAMWFPSDGNGGFVSPLGVYSTLDMLPGGTYSLTDHRGFVTNFAADGLQTARVDPNGNSTNYTYVPGDRLLETITDPFGRTTQFSYTDRM